MRYFIWIDGKRDGPYEESKICDMIANHQITDATLAYPEDKIGDWNPIKKYTQIFGLPNLENGVTSIPTPEAVPEFTLPPVQESDVTSLLTIIAVLEFIAAPIAGFIVGSDNVFVGWSIFLSGFISALILLGFARVIQNTFASSQRLKRIEILIQRRYDDNKLSDKVVTTATICSDPGSSSFERSDGIFESATKKIDSGRADQLTDKEKQRIDDIINWCSKCNKPLKQCPHGK